MVRTHKVRCGERLPLCYYKDDPRSWLDINNDVLSSVPKIYQNKLLRCRKNHAHQSDHTFYFTQAGKTSKFSRPNGIKYGI